MPLSKKPQHFGSKFKKAWIVLCTWQLKVKNIQLYQESPASATSSGQFMHLTKLLILLPIASKNLHSTAIKKPMPSKDEPDAILKNQSTSSQHRFKDRTLQLFLKEMRLAVKHEDPTKVNKYLLDI